MANIWTGDYDLMEETTEFYWSALPNDPEFDVDLSPEWINEFLVDERQAHELYWCLMYDAGFKHGTDGHHKLMLVARLYNLLDLTWRFLTPEQREKAKEVFVDRQSNGQSS